MSNLFGEAFKLAKAGEYWKAMNLNGMLLSTSLSTEYEPVIKAIQAGALAGSISGNGPAIASRIVMKKIWKILKPRLPSLTAA